MFRTPPPPAPAPLAPDAVEMAHYEIESRSVKGMLYTVRIYSDSTVTCTCYAHAKDPGRLCFHKQDGIRKFVRENPA